MILKQKKNLQQYNLSKINEINDHYIVKTRSVQYNTP
jgi:hypothetical protein